MENLCPNKGAKRFLVSFSSKGIMDHLYFGG
jgi:hypothetical protein